MVSRGNQNQYQGFISGDDLLNVQVVASIVGGYVLQWLQSMIYIYIVRTFDKKSTDMRLSTQSLLLGSER